MEWKDRYQSSATKYPQTNFYPEPLYLRPQGSSTTWMPKMESYVLSNPPQLEYDSHIYRLEPLSKVVAPLEKDATAIWSKD
jgi:hypothetical protein